MTVTLILEGMSCQHCVGAVTRALGALPGITALDVEVGRARFETPTPGDESAWRAALGEEGFAIASIERSPA